VRAFLDTPRLALREVEAGDVDAFYALDRDPSVMRYIADGKVGTRESSEKAVARALRYYGLYPGLGKWCAIERSSGRFAGWFSLNYVPKTVEVEVGYRLLPLAWGRGLATEGASALVRYGFDRVGLSRIIGLTHPDNLASQRVLQKAGLRAAGSGRYYERELRLFVAKA
jgi:RimJ/RimL family protein N-acetyltransferase